MCHHFEHRGIKMSSSIVWTHTVLYFVQARQLLHPIVAALDNGIGGFGTAADEARKKKLKEDQENRKMWLSHDVLTPEANTY